MSTYVTASVVGLEDGKLIIHPDCDVFRAFMKTGFERVEVRFDDGRTISADQRRKVFALVADIAAWNGDVPEAIRKYLMWDFCCKADIEPFSLKTVDMTTAREFINYLIEFCLMYDVPCMDTLLNRTDDIGRYLYLCLEYRRCCVCGKKADVHHVTSSRIGMGADRQSVHHLGREAIALCRVHHDKVHAIGEVRAFESWHVYAIKLDEYICKKLKLKL